MKKDMTFDSLYKSVSKLNEAFEDDTAKAINRNITARNWLIGFYIVHYEQKTVQNTAKRPCRSFLKN